jgi:hypothetical protein
MPRFVYSAMEIGYFLQNSSNWMKIYTIKLKLIKFKHGNTPNYTLNRVSKVKSFDYNISYHAQFYDEFGKIS